MTTSYDTRESPQNMDSKYFPSTANDTRASIIKQLYGGSFGSRSRLNYSNERYSNSRKSFGGDEREMIYKKVEKRTLRAEEVKQKGTITIELRLDRE